MTSLLKGLVGLLVPQIALPDDVLAAQVADMWLTVYGEAS